MSDENNGVGFVWIWPIISLLALVFMLLLKLNPAIRSSVTTTDITMETWGIIVILVMLVSFLGITLSMLSWFSKRESEIEMELMEELELDEGDEVLVAEIVDEPVPTKKVKKKKKVRKKPDYKVIEYPTKVEDGIFGDTFVRIDKKDMLKVRTKIAEESEV